MAVEERRACGYRKVGGLYLVGHHLLRSCDRLPFPLEVCPVCGEGLRWTRSPRRINALRLFGDHQDCHCRPWCYMCRPDDGPHYLLGVGHRQYTPEDFCFEAMAYGVCKRIPAVPRELELGVTWIYLVHRHAIARPQREGEIAYTAGVFCAFRPQQIELLVWESEWTEDLVEHYKDRGITAVPIPDGDPDHTPRGGKTT